MTAQSDRYQRICHICLRWILKVRTGYVINVIPTDHPPLTLPKPHCTFLVVS